MLVKSMKKQLLVAVAMLLVAVIALSSATYAWFVSNNTVEATTTSISAQSNAAYLVIDNLASTGTSETSTSATTASETPANTALYPARILTNGVWESAYAGAPTASTIKDGTNFTIGNDGTAAEAVTAGYATKNTFFIGTGGYDGSFTNLDVTSVEVSSTAQAAYTVAEGTETGYADETNTYAYLTGTTPAQASDFITKAAYDALASSELVGAIRVLIVCDTNWQVWGKNGQVTTDVNTKTLGSGTVLADTVVKGTDKTVEVYVYYDGDDTNVYSNNLPDLKDCGVTITFDATPVEYGA